MIKGLIIRTHGQPEEYEYNGDYKELQKIVGGYFEVISFGDKPYFCYINDEGKMLKLEQNRLATDLWYNSGQRVLIGDYIAGDAIFFGLPSDDGNDTDYPTRLIQDLRACVS